MSIRPFQISVPKDRLLRLKAKLALSDFPSDTLDNDSRDRGVPSSEIRRLSQYWADGFNWCTVQATLNKIPQFISSIEVENFGRYDIHFVHQRSTVTTAIPLLFLHGWPGSFVEVTKILPLLVKGGDNIPTFHVIAPSLVGFGFSSASKPGFNVDQHAEAYHKLMLSLGYTQYIIQGGDLGALIARFIASTYGPQFCKAHHLNTPLPSEPTATTNPALHAKIKDMPLSPSDLAGLSRTANFFKEGNGYLRLLSTKPQSLAFALCDSPIGLLAWVYEKLHDWSDDYPWTDDEILAWVSIHYFSVAGPAAANALYYEMEHREPPAFVAAQEYVDVPLGVSRFEGDCVLLPRAWNEGLGPVLFERVHGKGGHFAAWERPGEVVGDLRDMMGVVDLGV